MVKKQFLSLVISASLAAAPAVSVMADTYDEIASAQAEKNAAEYALENTRDKIYTLNEERSALQYYLEELDGQIRDLSSQLESISGQITQKTVDIKKAKAAVKRAKINERKQYNSMVSRIQYLYENGSADLMSSLLSSKDVTSFLNKASEAQDLAQYDRTKLEEYKATKEAVIDKQLSLEADQKKLNELYAENEQALQDVKNLAASTDEQIESYTASISEAEYKASGLVEEIAWQRSQIAHLEARAAEEEAERERERIRAEEEARWEAEHADDSEDDETEDQDEESYDEDDSANDEESSYDEDDRDEESSDGDEDDRDDESSDDEDDRDDESSDDEEDGWDDESSDGEDDDSDDESSDEDDWDEESSDDDDDDWDDESSDDEDDGDSGSSSGEYLGNFTLTAYCWCAKCNGSAGQPTASGTTPRSGHTVAMGGVDFGTKLLINGTVYTVEDRGTPYGHVDIFMDSHEAALDFGLQYADVYRLN